MILSDSLGGFLKSNRICKPDKQNNKYLLSAQDYEGIESGQLVVSLLQHLSQTFSKPFPSLDPLKNTKSNSAKLYNWKLILQALSQIGMDIDQDSRDLIISGDKDFTLELLEGIYKHYSSLDTPTKSKGKKPRLAPDGALYIESLDPRRGLQDTNSCLEFLLLSFCKNFELSPKQAAGLLTQNNKFLAHVIVKGLRGDHTPIYYWYNTLINHCDKLVGLIKAEVGKGSVNLILSALRPGLLSRNLSTGEKCTELLEIIFEKLSNELQLLWEWFSKEGLEACMLALNRLGEGVGENIAKIISKFNNEQFFSIVRDRIKEFEVNPYSYLKILQTLYSGFCKNPKKFRASGVLGYYLNHCLRDTETREVLEPKAQNSYYIKRINILCDIWVDFHEEVNEYSNEILTETKRAIKDKSIEIKYIIIGRLFYLLEVFYKMKSPVSGFILKTLIFMLIENYKTESLREFILLNFMQIFEQIDSLPVFSILDPLIRQIDYIHSVRFNTFDFDFFLAVCRHPRLSVENAVFLIDILSKVFLEDLLYSRAAAIPLIFLIGSSLEKPPIQEFTAKFANVSLSMIATSELTQRPKVEKNEKKGSTIARSLATSEIEESVNAKQRRNLVFDFVSKLIQLENEGLNENIKVSLLESNGKVRDGLGCNVKGFEILLDMMGDSQEMIKEFEQSRVVLYQRPSEIDQAVNLYRPPAISGRVAEDIERVKNNRELALQKKKKQEEDSRRKEQRLLENAYRDIENIKKTAAQYGIVDGFKENASGIENSMEYYEISLEPKNEVDLVDKIFRRYYLALKSIFKKYSKTAGFKIQGTNKNEIPERIITDQQVLALLKDEGLMPTLIKREDAMWLIKETSKRESSSLVGDAIRFNIKEFYKLLLQLSANIFRSDSMSNIMPLAYRLNLIIGQFRANERNSRIYDEFDPGAADKDVISYLNSLLATNPEYQLPSNIQRVVDYEIKIVYTIPISIGIPETHRHCLEVLDSIIFDKFQMHLLRPLMVAEEKIVARGVYPNGNRDIATLPLHLSISPVIKCEIMRNSAEFSMDLLVETGKVLEDLIYSAANGSIILQSVMPLSTKQIRNSYLKNKDLKIQQELSGKEKSEKMRRERKKELKDYLQQKKKEMESKENEEMRIQEEAKQLENKKLMELEEKKRREKDEKRKKIEEWKQQKLIEEKDKLLEKIKSSKPKKSGSALPKIVKSSSELLNLKKKGKHGSKPSETTQKFLKSPKDSKALSKILLESKRVQEDQKQKKDKFVEYYSRSDVKSILQEYSVTIETLYTHFLRTNSKNPNEISLGLDFKGINKLSLDLKIIPTLISVNDMLSIFNRVTKNKSKYANLQDLSEILAETAFTSSEYLKKTIQNSDETNGETLRALLQYMKLFPEIKNSGILLQALNKIF